MVPVVSGQGYVYYAIRKSNLFLIGILSPKLLDLLILDNILNILIQI
jgi:hypothetical protein